MTFLQPWALAALPLVTLPIIIHLINQRRFQTVDWAAMMFLLSAKTLARGYSRLRHWLIMALRMLAVAAVILAIGRPLSRGWLALAGGGRPDTAIVILDRSPSMQAREAAAAETKLDTGRQQLASSLATLGASRCVLLSTVSDRPLELANPAALADLPATGPAAAASDMPRLLQAAFEHIRDNASGATEVWICSDQRANDWSPEGGEWKSLRDAFARLPQQVRFQMVSYPQPAAGNLAVRVKSARIERRGEERQLALSVEVLRSEGGEPATVPVTIEVGGVPTAVDVEVAGREGVLEDHVVPLPDGAAARGWGKVSIPADANAADNEFFFVFDEPTVRRAIVVADDPEVRRVLELVAGIAPEKDMEAVVDTITPDRLADAPWQDAAVLLWQSALPEGEAADLVNTFLDRGGQAIFMPPSAPGSEAFAGLSWTGWTDHERPLKPQSWRTDEDLLANTRSGAALPVGELVVRRSCGIAGEHVPLCSLSADDTAKAGEAQAGGTLLARVAVPRGGVSFLATSPAAPGSSLAADGVVLYSLVQRAIDRGAAVLGKARQADAGSEATKAAAGPTEGEPWKRLAGPADAGTGTVGVEAGVFAAGERLLAVNRPRAEDTAGIVADTRLDELFTGLPLNRIRGTAGITDSLVQEIWRAFLVAMLLAMIAEGILCMPKRAVPTAPFGRPLEAAA